MHTLESGQKLELMLIKSSSPLTNSPTFTSPDQRTPHPHPRLVRVLPIPSWKAARRMDGFATMRTCSKVSENAHRSANPDALLHKYSCSSRGWNGSGVRCCPGTPGTPGRERE